MNPVRTIETTPSNRCKLHAGAIGVEPERAPLGTRFLRIWFGQTVSTIGSTLSGVGVAIRLSTDRQRGVAGNSGGARRRPGRDCRALSRAGRPVPATLRDDRRRCFRCDWSVPRPASGTQRSPRNLAPRTGWLRRWSWNGRADARSHGGVTPARRAGSDRASERAHTTRPRSRDHCRPDARHATDRLVGYRSRLGRRSRDVRDRRAADRSHAFSDAVDAAGVDDDGSWRSAWSWLRKSGRPLLVLLMSMSVINFCLAFFNIGLLVLATTVAVLRGPASHSVLAGRR